MEQEQQKCSIFPHLFIIHNPTHSSSLHSLILSNFKLCKFQSFQSLTTATSTKFSLHHTNMTTTMKNIHFRKPHFSNFRQQPRRQQKTKTNFKEEKTDSDKVRESCP